MRILFMGTPEFAVASLSALAKSGHTVAAVVTQPDKPKGRGHKLCPPPVKVAAQELGIPVYQPQTLKNGAFKEQLETIAPDVVVVVAYGKILPSYVLEFPKYGCINVHASLLPKYRGAAPIERCVMDGQTETGITTMQMDTGIDTGDMLLTVKTQIGERETASALRARLADIGAQLLIETLSALESKSLTPIPQDDAQATYAPMLSREDGRLDFTKPCRTLFNIIRAVPAFTYYQGKKMKVLCAEVEENPSLVASPGKILSVSSDGIRVKAQDGALVLKSIQMEGKKPMEVSAYLLGNSIEPGTILSGEA